jgi:glycosyltransferase involved in cell wall biosynthesis
VSGVGQQKLRVCFFIPEFSYGGAQKQCILLLNELQRRDDIEILLIRFRAAPQDHLLDTSRLRCEFIQVQSNFDPRAVIAARRLVSEFRADVIISWIRVCDIYAAAVQAMHPQVKWIMTQRNSRPPGSWLASVRHFVGRRADAIAANSPGGVQWWRERGARGPVYLVDNIADPGLAGLPDRVPRSVLYVGRLVPQKNVLTMVRAFERVVQQHPEVTIWVCGDGELRSQMEMIAASSVAAGQISFLGFRPDAGEWMSRAKVLVSLSDYEGMPNVLMEGIRAGCAIVASSIPEHVDLMGESYPFLVENYHDVDEVVETITRALDASEVIDGLQHARDVLARMEPSAVAARYMEIFRVTASHHPLGSS